MDYSDIGWGASEIVCRWDEDAQTCILEAPYTGPAPADPSQLIMTGTRARFDGNLSARHDKRSGRNPIINYSVMFNSEASNFVSGSPLNMMDVFTSEPRGEFLHSRIHVN